jgi:GntR family transcriptional regulator
LSARFLDNRLALTAPLMSPIRRDGAEPLHLQVSRQIGGEIASGLLRAGDRLPPERVLCERLQVSRVTLRRGLAKLVDEGLLQPSHGRGWYVAAEQLGEPPNTLISFTGMGAARGLTAKSRVLASRIRRASLDEAEALGIAPGAEIFELERVRFLDGTPIAIDWSRLPAACLPDLAGRDFAASSLYAALEENGVMPTRATCAVEAVEAGKRHARLLEIEPGTAQLVLHQTTYDQRGAAIELGRIAYPGDRYRFRAVLVRPP